MLTNSVNYAYTTCSWYRWSQTAIFYRCVASFSTQGYKSYVCGSTRVTLSRLQLAIKPFMQILRTNIVNSLLQEGPGFPYLSLYVYWYLVTGCDETALSCYYSDWSDFICCRDSAQCKYGYFYAISKLLCKGTSLGGGVGGGFLATLCTCEWNTDSHWLMFYYV